jgi:hypothetical protein
VIAMRKILIAVGLLSVMAGCGTAEGYSVQFMASSGLAGAKVLSLSPEGEGVAEVRGFGGERQKEFTLTPSEHREFQAKLARALAWHWAETYGHSGAVDGPALFLVVTRDEERRRTSMDPERRPLHLLELTGELDRLLKANLPE